MGESDCVKYPESQRQYDELKYRFESYCTPADAEEAIGTLDALVEAVHAEERTRICTELMEFHDNSRTPQHWRIGINQAFRYVRYGAGQDGMPKP